MEVKSLSMILMKNIRNGFNQGPILITVRGILYTFLIVRPHVQYKMVK